MSSPILSQDEIEALLHRSNQETPSTELQDFLYLVAQNMTSWVNDLSVDPLEIEGPYVERLGKSLEQSFSDEVLAVAVDLADSELLMIMSAVDASFLAGRLQRSTEESMQILSRAWIKQIADLSGVPYQVFQVQRIPLRALGQLALEPQAYLVRHLFRRHSHKFEFALIVQNSDSFESLAKSAMEVVSFTQAKETLKGRLLKSNKSKSPVTRALFTPIDEIVQIEDDQGIALLEDIDLTVTVELGQTTLTLEQILDLEPQTVISLERHAGEPVDVYINETRAARAEVVVLEENFGVRILEILPKSQHVQGE